MPNTTGGDKVFETPWISDRLLKLPVAVPATSTIFYAGQAIGRNAAGNLVQCDDTSKFEFLGIVQDLVRTQVDPSDQVQVNGILGDKMLIVSQSLYFTPLIAAAAAGDEGRKVYWQFNNQVSYSPGVNANYAGTVWQVKDATHVVVSPPWNPRGIGDGPVRSVQTLPAGNIVLTKWDVNRSFWATVGQQITLPPVAQCSPGDFIRFVYIGAGAQVVTLKGNAAELVNGLNTLALATAQYSRLAVETDGNQWMQA